MVTANKGIKFELEAFKKGEFAVNCETEEEAEIFLKYLNEKGFRWYSSTKLTQITNWKECQNKTCYLIEGIWGNSQGLSYSSIDVEEIPILKYSELDFSEKKKTNFERIKEMTIEELSKIIIPRCRNCFYKKYCAAVSKEKVQCQDEIKSWLESEVEE